MSRAKNSSSHMRFITLLRPWLFPLGVIILYGLGLMFAPENTHKALSISGSIFKKLALPICFAIIVMVLFNRFLSPATITNFLGKNAGIKGVVLSSLAGVLSMGPVYAWYPLLKTLIDKGASKFHVANFIGSRSIKPFLLPVLVAYWGWRFALLFILMSLAGSLIVAFIVSVCCSD
ncbi:MAG: hypothetical protein K8R67_02955 [Desulfobacteraceae bacterium]|nr:hypothetical protein [Desulfobacteraceae bacterium]